MVATAVASVLTLSACASSATPTGSPATGASAAAYVDVTAPRDTLAPHRGGCPGCGTSCCRSSLAEAAPAGPSWGGIRDLHDPALVAEIADLRCGRRRRSLSPPVAPTGLPRERLRGRGVPRGGLREVLDATGSPAPRHRH